MSMYEPGNLVEESIIVIGKSQNSNLDKKTIIWNLYNNIQSNVTIQPKEHSHKDRKAQRTTK